MKSTFKIFVRKVVFEYFDFFLVEKKREKGRKKKKDDEREEQKRNSWNTCLALVATKSCHFLATCLVPRSPRICSFK
jgi:hypothetical protein